MNTMANALMMGVYHAAPVSQAALAPMRYARLVAIITPNVASVRIANAQRFHAVMKPPSGPNPTVAH
jgi:hypothetical protein